MFLVPVSVLRRRINGNFRRAFAFGIFVGCVRLFSHVIYKQTRRLTSPGTLFVRTGLDFDSRKNHTKEMDHGRRWMKKY